MGFVIVTGALGIPYVLAEASHAPRRTYGPTRLGHRAVERANDTLAGEQDQ